MPRAFEIADWPAVTREGLPATIQAVEWNLTGRVDVEISFKRDIHAKYAAGRKALGLPNDTSEYSKKLHKSNLARAWEAAQISVDDKFGPDSTLVIIIDDAGDEEDDAPPAREIGGEVPDGGGKLKRSLRGPSKPVKKARRSSPLKSSEPSSEAHGGEAKDEVDDSDGDESGSESEDDAALEDFIENDAKPGEATREWAPEDALEMEDEDLENLGVGDLIALAAQAGYAISKRGKNAAPVEAKVNKNALDDTSGAEDEEEGDEQIMPVKGAAKDDRADAKDDKIEVKGAAGEPEADKTGPAGLHVVLTSFDVPSETQDAMRAQEWDVTGLAALADTNAIMYMTVMEDYGIKRGTAFSILARLRELLKKG